MIRKNIDLIILAFIALALILFEETEEIVEEFVHLLLEVLHNLFEVVELGVDGVVERAFHFFDVGEFFAYLFITERHASQVFTFYILMSMIGYILFKLSKFVPRIYGFLKRVISMAWLRRKTQCQLFWRTLTRVHKLLIFVVLISFLVFAVFFLI
jgi:hypothetical protein